VSRPAPALRYVRALARHDLRLTARRGENVLVTIVIPIAVLLFFAGTSIIPNAASRPVDFLLPGAIALGIVASGLVNLGIATAYDRSYGVLKRLGGAPLPGWALVAAKAMSILALEVVQVAALVAVGVLLLGWTPGSGWSPLLFGLAVALGTTTFVSLGLLLAGSLRAEATLALANGLFLALLMLGGIVLPIDHLPAALQPIAALLPATALADLLRISLASGVSSASAPMSVGILTAWAAASAAIAIRTFRWE
jgi:ABC-2 type transport system permease protein